MKDSDNPLFEPRPPLSATTPPDGPPPGWFGVSAAGEYPRGKTLQRAREETWAERGDGTWCPCCGGRVKTYKRAITDQMAQFLLRVAKVVAGAQGATTGWCKNREAMPGAAEKASSDGSRLVEWGLLERHPEHRGTWRPTAKGWRWARGNSLVSASALVTMGGVEAWSDERVSIREALKRPWDWEDTIQGLLE